MQGRTGIALFLLLVVGVVVATRPASAAPDDSTAVRPGNPWVAFGLGVVVPGGGQFYNGDISEGVQAVVSDLIIAGALLETGAAGSSIITFVASMHVIEGMFAAQVCRTRRAEAKKRAGGSTSTTMRWAEPASRPARIAHTGDARTVLTYSIPIGR